MHLIREQLRPLLTSLRSAHAGLLVQRGLPVWEEGEKAAKAKLVDTVANISCPEFYPLAFDRWFQLTQKEQFASVAAKVDGRLFTGLALGGTLETGMMTHHTYGTPLLAGSSIKGATRSYAESIGVDAEVIRVLFGAGDDDDSGAEAAGSLIWHDAWWVPRDTNTKPFVKDVVTVHEQSYYSEKTAVADGSESPVPNLQIGIQGEFYFVVEGEAAWARYAADLLNMMLKEQGLGSKTATGYGYFVEETALDRYLERKSTDIALKEVAQSGDSSAILRVNIEKLDEAGLVTSLSKDLNKFLKGLEIDREDTEALKTLCSLVQELRGDWVAEWAGTSEKNKKRAAKFVQDHA